MEWRWPLISPPEYHPHHHPRPCPRPRPIFLFGWSHHQSIILIPVLLQNILTLVLVFAPQDSNTRWPCLCPWSHHQRIILILVIILLIFAVDLTTRVSSSSSLPLISQVSSSSSSYCRFVDVDLTTIVSSSPSSYSTRSSSSSLSLPLISPLEYHPHNP